MLIMCFFNITMEEARVIYNQRKKIGGRGIQELDSKQHKLRQAKVL